LGVTSLTFDQFLATIRTNPINAALLERLPALDLPQCHLVAGCLYQTVWNHRSGFAPTAHIKDYDVFYFDDTDLSWEVEDRVIRRVNALCADLNATVEVKNQARVHLWDEQRFGKPYPKLTSARDGIDRYLSLGTRVGIEVTTGALYAPGGLEDTCAGILRINPLNPIPHLFLEKAEDLKRRWEWLTIVHPPIGRLPFSRE
jgi:hypothetical protein